MTREIKFRAWDKEAKRWVDEADFLVSSTGAVLLHDINFGAKYGNLTGKWREDEEGRIELVCFTGLKDKKGKEIYEGDVVRVVNEYEKVNFGGVLETETRAIQWTERGWSPFVEPGGIDCNFPYQIEGVEIIGNIYENPDLLANN